MPKTTSIRSRIVITFAVLLLIDAGSILLLEHRLENRVLRTYLDTTTQIPLHYYTGTVLAGNESDGFFINRFFQVVSGDGRAQAISRIIQKLRLQMSWVFGVSMALGVIITLLVSRSIAKPIVQLARSSKNLANGNLDENLAKSRCTEFQMLADSLRTMQRDLREIDEEKSRLESVEITKNLAAGIAHEIKNPINTVGLIVDYLQTNLSPDVPEKRYEFYKLSENLKKEIKRINRIVEGFLRLTKPSVYSFAVENLNELVRESVSTLEPEMAKNGVIARLELNPDPPSVRADRDKLAQVFTNLLLNSVEAMPRGGEISVTTRIAEGKAAAIFSDNGIGIPQDNMKKIFNPYFSTKKQGFGLGLSIAQDIVHKHDGKLSVNSERGRGTEFIVYLPLGNGNE
jgi:signal transduction histidine kinase